MEFGSLLDRVKIELQAAVRQLARLIGRYRKGRRLARRAVRGPYPRTRLKAQRFRRLKERRAQIEAIARKYQGYQQTRARKQCGDRKSIGLDFSPGDARINLLKSCHRRPPEFHLG